MDSLGNLDLTKLSDRDKQELQQFVVNESQKAKIQACTHSIFSSPMLFHVHDYSPTSILKLSLSSPARQTTSEILHG